MYHNIDEYLTQLRSALQGCDAATIQDALADAEDHLRLALASAKESTTQQSDTEILAGILEEYGSPEEVAAAYRDIERRLPPALAPSARSAAQAAERPVLARFFGVVVEPQAWGALLYMIFSLVTGILYFTWAVTGLSLSLGLMVLVIGLPFMLLFMLSVRGISLVEGRIVEALLGVRMPRRAIFVDSKRGFWNRVRDLLLSWLTWKTILYMLLMLPLGILYFTLFITLLALGVGLIAAPFAQLIYHFPILTINEAHYLLPGWWMPLWVLGGVLLLLASMHLAKWLGGLQGSFAKFMLVG